MSQPRSRRTAALSFLAAGALVPPLLIAGTASAGPRPDIGVAGSAVAAAPHDVRKADFITALSDTRANGYYGFGPKGLLIHTDGSTDLGTDGKNSDKVAEYYAAPGTLPDTGSQLWSGSQPEPGKQIVFNSGVTGDSGYNILVGEPTYGSDWWMSTGSYIYKNHHELCPETTGGSGSNCHGTLAKWKTAFGEAKVEAYGFSLGSGVKGDGVLKSQTFGGDTYNFVDTPAPAPVVSPPTSPPPATLVPAETSITPSTSSVKRGKYVSFNGAARPFLAGGRVALQRHYNHAWHLVKAKALSNSGKYHFAYKATSRGNKYFRAVIRATSKNLRGVSRTVRLHVR